MMDGWVVEVLKSNGLAGVIIFLLAAANIAQWTRSRLKDRELSKLHEQRSVERETLVKLQEQGNAVAATTAQVTAERNEVIDRLSAAITSHAGSNDKLAIQVTAWAEMSKERLDDVRKVIDATGESYRVNNGLVSELRNMMTVLNGKADGLLIEIKILGRNA